jgi:hypothetical protein
MGDVYAVTSMFKPNAVLSNVTEGIGNLCLGVTKEDQVVIIVGPGKSLDRNLNYQLRKTYVTLSRKLVAPMRSSFVLSGDMSSHGLTGG